ncbi:MAG: M48 family metallopeptidase [Bacteriovoracia bacterium]
MTKIALFCFLLISTFTFNGCSMLNPGEDQVEAMALEAYQKFKSEAKISDNKEWQAMVDRVAKRVTQASGQDEEWEWILVENPEVNAWAMPGGKIAVYTGLLPVVQTEAGLAAVLGHEVAHVTKEHGHERYARAIKGSLAGLVIGAATAVGGQMLCKSEACRYLTGLGGAAAGFAITFFERKFSREQELEADQAGQKYMAGAGYIPSEAVQVWDRMAQQNKGPQPPEFLSTHPSDQIRKEKLNNYLPESMEIYRENRQSEQYGVGETITRNL